MTIDADSQKMTVTLSFSFHAEVFEGEDDMFEVAEAELPDMEDIIQKTLDANYDSVSDFSIKIVPNYL